MGKVCQKFPSQGVDRFGVRMWNVKQAGPEGERQGTRLPRPGKAAQGSFGLKGVREGERLRSIWRRGSQGVHRIAKPA